ncbi:MAG TPA: OmpA family protein [Nitrospiria bacterium]|jgi:chemotaxis protein MotB|nr:OmpA family protein [Nitrospiria bacterium]
MNNYIRIGMVVLAAGMIVSGCVSSGKYTKMEKAKNDEITSLQQEKSTLEQQKAALEKDNAGLKQQISSLDQHYTSAQQQVRSLQQENASLVASSERQQEQFDALVKDLSSEVQKGELQVKQYKNMLSVELAEQIFFDSGRAKLKPRGTEVLKKVGEALKGYGDKIIRVVGHTDNRPVAKSLQGTFPTNWELSVARATTVVRFLQDVGVPPERMVASGRAEYDPVAPNDTPEGRQQNRRIEIMLIDKNLVSEMTQASK